MAAVCQRMPAVLTPPRLRPLRALAGALRRAGRAAAPPPAGCAGAGRALGARCAQRTHERPAKRTHERPAQLTHERPAQLTQETPNGHTSIAQLTHERFVPLTHTRPAPLMAPVASLSHRRQNAPRAVAPPHVRPRGAPLCQRGGAARRPRGAPSAAALPDAGDRAAAQPGGRCQEAAAVQAPPPQQTHPGRKPDLTEVYLCCNAIEALWLVNGGHGVSLGVVDLPASVRTGGLNYMLSRSRYGPFMMP
eukprot:COSAG01_NODE_1801_length_9200_cov_13.641358_9_plen_249_part_00